MNDKLKDPKMDDLFRAIMSLRSLEEYYSFFDDLCTISELKAMEQRYQVAKLLDQGKVYSDIALATGASSATISRVNRALLYGSDGYRTALEREKE